MYKCTINIKEDKKCKEYLHARAELAATGRVVRYVRAELSATGQAVHGPSCPRAELSGIPYNTTNCIYRKINKMLNLTFYIPNLWIVQLNTVWISF